MSVNRNIAAGFLGNTWTALVQIAFIPIYIRILGMEAYGLMGVYAFLQVALSCLDFGLIPTLSREAARFTAGAHSVGEMRSLLRSVEVVFVSIAAVVFATVVAAAPWIARSWLNAETLPVPAATRAIGVMGALLGLRWLTSVYRAAITGMQDLVWLNVAGAAFATVRGAGVVPVLLWMAPTIEAFFLFQAAVAVAELAAMHQRSWRFLASADEASFSAQSLHRIWRFSAGVTVFSLLYLLLHQADKMLLSAMLSLKAFGYYALASSVAGSLNLLIAPIGGVAYPRLNALVARGDATALAQAYHRFSQMLTLAIAPGALVLALFPERILMLWIGDPTTCRETAPLVALLAVGALLNAFMSMPHMLQLALGRTRFIIALNGAYLVVFLPAVYFGVSAYGAIASACAWIAINLCGIVLAVPLMHRNMLPQEMWRWYGSDIALPAAAALAAAFLVRSSAPVPSVGGTWSAAMVVSAALVLAYGACLLASPIGRRLLMQGWSSLSGSRP
jgi:O-antigen/teichoic acid export membrane protein